MEIKIGPAGLGPVKIAEKTLEEYAKLGFKACEIAFTYSVYIKNKKDAERIGKKASKLGISLSIHAPYFVNLNSAEKEKREATKKRILVNGLRLRGSFFIPGTTERNLERKHMKQ
jgi:deoxyribonuclease IV